MCALKVAQQVTACNARFHFPKEGERSFSIASSRGSLTVRHEAIFALYEGGVGSASKRSGGLSLTGGRAGADCDLKVASCILSFAGGDGVF